MGFNIILIFKNKGMQNNQERRKSVQDLHFLLTQQSQTIEFGESPIDELEIQYKGTQDLDQIRYILTQILTYPSTDLAKLHKHANKLGTTDLHQDHENNLTFEQLQELGKQTNFCPCCGFIKQHDEIKLCTGIDAVQNLGISTKLYFQTLKNLAFLLIVMTLVYSIYALVTNIIASNRYQVPEDLDSLKSNIDVVSLAIGSKLLDHADANERQNEILYLVQCWIGVGLVLLFGIFFVVFERRQKSAELKMRRQTKSASDFSIIMEQVPTSMTQEDMQKQFTRYQSTIDGIPTYYMKKLQIAKYNVAKPFYLNESRFQNEEIIEVNKEFNEAIEMYIKWIEERKQSDEFSVPKDQRKAHYKAFNELKVKRLNAYKKVTDEILEEFKQENIEPTTTVFITFKSSFNKQVVLNLNEDNLTAQIRYLLGCCQDRNKFNIVADNGQIIDVKIKEAPEPEDIIWTNLGQSKDELVKRKIITFFSTFILLGISLGIVIGLSYAQNANLDNFYISILISLIISIVNVLIQQSLRRLTILEREYTETNHQASLGIKAVIALLLNSILIPIIANEFIKEKNIYGVKGLAYDVFLLGITNSFLQPIMKVFDMYYYYTRILAWWYNKSEQKLYLNQPDLNLYNEYIEFETGYEYIYIVNLFLFTCFFVSLQPIISVFALVGMIMMYWAQKYSVYSRTKRPVPGTTAINTAMYQLIYMGPLFFSLGNFTWSHFLTEEQDYDADPARLIPNIISVALSVIIFILPYRLIFELIFDDEVELQMLFDENRIYLPSEYDRLNPSTSEEAISEYLNYVETYKENLKKKSDGDIKEFQLKFFNQMRRGHQISMNARPSGGRNSLLDQIFAPQGNQINQMMIAQTLFQNKSNPFPMLVQNWHSPNQPIQPNPLIKMTESSHMMQEKKQDNVLPNIFGSQEGQHPPNLPPFQPYPNYQQQSPYANNPFGQLFHRQPHSYNPQQFPQNQYYPQNNQNPQIPNPFGNPYNRQGF